MPAGYDDRPSRPDVNRIDGATNSQSIDRAAVEPLESPADHLALPDGVVDAAYCQQGLQFMSDRHAVITEMLRVLRPGGALAIAVWSDQSPPEPFASYARILQDHGVLEPYPNAYDTSIVTMSEREIENLLTTVASELTTVRTVEVPLLWPAPRWAALGITGSTYGPTVAALDLPQQEALFAAIEEQASSDSPVIMKAVLGSALAG